MFTNQGTVIHFNNPKVQASLAANTFTITGHAETKQLTEMLPGILNQLGADSLTSLRRLAEALPKQGQWPMMTPTCWINSIDSSMCFLLLKDLLKGMSFALQSLSLAAPLLFVMLTDLFSSHSWRWKSTDCNSRRRRWWRSRWALKHKHTAATMLWVKQKTAM